VKQTTGLRHETRKNISDWWEDALQRESQGYVSTAGEG